MKHLFQHLQEKLIINKNTKIVKDDEIVDLGLPSGLLWCKHNVGAEEETDKGLYFSWGNTDGHYDDGYKFDEDTYETTNGGKLEKSFKPGDKEYDAATANMGSKWRMPTTDEFNELYDNTEQKCTEINGVKGMKFISKEDPEKYIFFSSAGCYNGTALRYDNTDGYYWSVDITYYYAYTLNFNSFDVNPANRSNFRYCGCPVRAVQN